MIFKKKHKSLIRGITLVLILTFAFNFVFPINLVYAASQINQAGVEAGQPGIATHYDRQKTGKSSLAKLADELVGLKQQIHGHKLKSDKKAAREAVNTSLTAIKALDADVQAELSSTEQKLKNAEASRALERHNRFAGQYRDNITKLESNLQSIIERMDIAAGDSFSEQEYRSFTQQLQNILEQASPAPKEQSLGTELPHRTYDAQPQAPQTNGGITPAYSVTAASGQSTGLSEIPTAEDLAETIETRLTKAIQELATQLNHDPVKIYDYVKNQIDFEPYYGSRKGAQETLLEKGGNDFDQASLLISLFRASGYPARYIYGTVEVPGARAMGWTGANSVSDAARILSAAGIPVTSVAGGGEIGAVRLEHAWVEVYLPYTNYRGIPAGSGEQTWIPLDPSFKQYAVTPGINLEEIAGINGQNLVSQLVARSNIDQQNGTVTDMDYSYLWDQMDAINKKVSDYLAANEMQNAPPQEIFGGKSIQKEEPGLLPASLPYQTTTILNEFTAVPENQQEWVEFSIYGADPFGINFGDLTPDFAYKATTAELAGRRITLSWTPGTEEDQAVVNQYGQLYQTPAYLVEVRPELRIDGQVVATGQPVGMAYQQKFTMNFISAGGVAERVDNQVTAGAYYAVGLDLQSITPAILQQRLDKITQASSTINEQNIISDDGVGEMLYTTALAYFAQVDAYQKIIGRNMGVTSVRQTSEAITALDLSVGYFFMCPVSVSLGGMHIDVDRDICSPVSLNGDGESVRNFMLQSGIMGSAMEHGIFEQLYGFRSISAAKVMTLANAWGIPIYTVTAENISQVLPKLQVSSRVKSDIQNSINAGHTVTIPEQELDYYEWHGVGYIDADPSSGSAAYMISGYLAGGATAFKMQDAVVLLSAFLALAISLPFVVEMFVAGGAINIFFGAVDLYFSGEVLYNLVLYFRGDPQAGENVKNSALFAAGGAGLFKLIKAASPFAKTARSLTKAKIIELLDSLSGGAAARLKNWGFDENQILVMREVNVDLKYLSKALEECDDFNLFLGLKDFTKRCLNTGELGIDRISGELYFRLENRVTLNLSRLAEAKRIGDIDTVNKIFQNLQGCYTELKALESALQSGTVKKVILDISHVNHNGIDDMYETIYDTLHIQEAKSSKDVVGFEVINDFISKEYINGVTTYKFNIKDYLDNIEKVYGKKGLEYSKRIREAVTNGKLEFEFFINTPVGKGTSLELQTLNGQVINNIKIIITSIHV